MAIIRDQSGLATLLGVARSTITWWLARGLPYTRKGFVFYFDSSEVKYWLEYESAKRYSHLIKILDKYKG